MSFPRRAGFVQGNAERAATKAKKGFCRTGLKPWVASFGPHFGEERELVGRFGSGTIFFSGCNLGCVFCQNFTISQLGERGRNQCGGLGKKSCFGFRI